MVPQDRLIGCPVAPQVFQKPFRQASGGLQGFHILKKLLRGDQPQVRAPLQFRHHQGAARRGPLPGPGEGIRPGHQRLPQGGDKVLQFLVIELVPQGRGVRIRVGPGFGQGLGKGLLPQGQQLAVGGQAEGWVDARLAEMILQKALAEGMQGGYMGAPHPGGLPPESGGTPFPAQRRLDALPHFGGGGAGEGDDQHPVDVAALPQ